MMEWDEVITLIFLTEFNVYANASSEAISDVDSLILTASSESYSSDGEMGQSADVSRFLSTCHETAHSFYHG